MDGWMHDWLFLNSIWNINAVWTTCPLYGYLCDLWLVLRLGPTKSAPSMRLTCSESELFVFVMSLFWEFVDGSKLWFKFEMLDDDKTRKGEACEMHMAFLCTQTHFVFQIYYLLLLSQLSTWQSWGFVSIIFSKHVE